MPNTAAQLCISSITATVSRLVNVSPPHLCDAPPIPAVLKRFAGTPIDRCLIYAPDAIGAVAWEKYPGVLRPVLDHAPLTVSLCAVTPSVTPVCFASMFTGTQPLRHGIQRYEKPVLKCDTLFDALLRGGKKVAVVAVRACSIDIIFGGCAFDHFSETYDAEVEERTLLLLQEDRHDVILAYNQEYDDQLHKTTPFSPQCMTAMCNHVATFTRLAAAATQAWQAHNYILMFTPDHGCHVDATSGKGSHGADIPEDMQVIHCFGGTRR